MRDNAPRERPVREEEGVDAKLLDVSLQNAKELARPSLHLTCLAITGRGARTESDAAEAAAFAMYNVSD